MAEMTVVTILLFLTGLQLLFVYGSTSHSEGSSSNPYEGQNSSRTKLDRPISANSEMCKNATVSESDISRDVFGKHQAWERPLIQARKPIEVEIRLVLSSINDVIEKDKILKLTGYLLFYWFDEFHVWNTTFPHACLASVVVPQKDIWIPEIAMINSEQHYELLLMHNEEMVRMSSNGYASYRPGGTFRAYCDFNLRYFPFDEQDCILTLESWRYTIDFQKFHFGDAIQFRYWIENEQWKLINTSQRTYSVQYVVATNVFSRVEFEMQLQRKVGYYTINVIVPSVIISVAQIGTFTLPVDEVMKIHISFTCLLAYGVFQLMIIEDIPRTSDRIPLLCYYIALSMVYICLSILGEGLVFACVRKGMDKRHKHFVPDWLFMAANVVGKWLDIKPPKMLLYRNNKPNGEGGEMDDEALMRYAKVNSNHFMSLIDLKNPEQQMTELERKQAQQLRDADEQNTHHDADIDRQHRWEFVADVLDRIVMLTYLFLIVATPIAMFAIIPARTRKYS